MTSEADLELARIIGKAEAGKPLSAKEELMLLPYAILEDIDKMYEEFKRDGKIKPRRRHTPNL